VINIQKFLFLSLLLSTLLLSNSSAQSIGYGISENEALKSAYQNAVEEYVGVLVDTKTVIKNSKLIQNDILTFSNGYIDSYKKISSKEQLGLWTVKIEAVIKKQDVLSKIKTLKIEPRHIKDGDQLYAKIVSQVKTKFDFEDMIVSLVKENGQYRSLLEYIIPNIESINLDIDSATRTEVEGVIEYSARFNFDKYNKFAYKIETLFKKTGAKIIGVHNINSNNKFENCKKIENTIGVVVLKNKKYVLHIWKFPNSYKVVYPIKSYFWYGNFHDYNGWNNNLFNRWCTEVDLQLLDKNKKLISTINGYEEYDTRQYGILSYLDFNWSYEWKDYASIDYSDEKRDRTPLISPPKISMTKEKKIYKTKFKIDIKDIHNLKSTEVKFGKRDNYFRIFTGKRYDGAENKAYTEFLNR